MSLVYTKKDKRQLRQMTKGARLFHLAEIKRKSHINFIANIGNVQMNYREAEPSKYQKQDRCASRIKKQDFYVLVLGSKNPESVRYTRGRA